MTIHNDVELDPPARSRRRIPVIRRTLVGVGLAATLAVGGTTVAASPAQAAGCVLGLVCGEVYNGSPWAMHTTEYLGGSHGDRCDVWNWNGGSARAWRSRVACEQKRLSAHSARGGRGVDVDAFTFNDRGYLLNLHGKRSWQKKGVWTKISDWDTANCTMSSSYGVPYCSVY
jgi:hypothetical protein